VGTLNIGIGVIFIVVEMVENVVYADLSGDCLMRRVVEARRADAKNVVRGWWKRRR
jgi:hypothetical protein